MLTSHASVDDAELSVIEKVNVTMGWASIALPVTVCALEDKIDEVCCVKLLLSGPVLQELVYN